VFQVSLRLRRDSETPVRVIASDFAGHQTALELNVHRPTSRRPSATRRASPVGNTWALFVGVDRYLHFPGASTLQYPSQDIQRLYDLICDPAEGGVDPSHAFLLHDNREEDQDRPTRANIERRIAQIGKLAQPADTVLIFFSGHGAVSHGKTYLLTRDSQAGRVEETALSGAVLDRLLSALPTRHVILFLDACHAAGIEGDPDGDEALAGQRYGRILGELGGACHVFASCGADELSYEDPLGLEAGVFAHFAAEGLSGRAASHGGAVRLDDLVTYVESHVRDWCRANLEKDDLPQQPVCLPAGWHDDLPLCYPRR
jgi:uncharacterized caspase-like protein